MAYDVVFLRRDLPLASALMPQTIKRLKVFCDTYDTDTRPEELEEQVWRLFGSADPRLGLWVVVKDMRRVVGHLLAQPEPIDVIQGPWAYALIRQAEVDKGEDTRSETKVIFESVQAWTRSLGLERILLLTHRRGSVIARRWGFKSYKTLMEMKL